MLSKCQALPGASYIISFNFQLHSRVDSIIPFCSFRNWNTALDFFYCGIKDHWIIVVWNRLIMFMKSVGQELEQDITEVACLYSKIPEAVGRSPMSRDWNQQEISLCQVWNLRWVDVWAQLRLPVRATYLRRGLSMYLSFLLAAGFF